MPRPRRPVTLPAELVALARRCLGLLSTAELVHAGIDRNDLRRLRLAQVVHLVHRGIWSIDAEPSLPARVAAASRACGGGGVACLQSAVLLHGLDGGPGGANVHVSLPPEATRHQLAGVTRHWLTFAVEDVVEVRGVATTSVARLLFDAGKRWSAADLLSLSDSALRHHVVTPQEVADVAARLGGAPARWLTLSDPRSESPLESRLRLLLHDAGLADVFVPQWPVRLTGGGQRRLDFASASLKLGIECDGKGPHERPDALFLDRRRADDLADLGWRLIRVTWEDVTRRPDDVVRRIRRAMSAAAA